MSEQLWTEVGNTVQEAVTKIIPKKKKCKKAKCLSEESLHMAEERREARRKGERERYTQLNAEFQKIERRDKKAFFNEQCKEVEENNKMGETRELFKKTGDAKGTFHASMGTIKDRSDKDLTEAEEVARIHRTIQKKDLNDPDNHDGVITHQEPDIAECEVK